jgi:hypothetical protein
MIPFTLYTQVKVVKYPTPAFPRYTYKLTSFENIEDNVHSKTYLIGRTYFGKILCHHFSCKIMRYIWLKQICFFQQYRCHWRLHTNWSTTSSWLQQLKPYQRHLHNRYKAQRVFLCTSALVMPNNQCSNSNEPFRKCSFNTLYLYINFHYFCSSSDIPLKWLFGETKHLFFLSIMFTMRTRRNSWSYCSSDAFLSNPNVMLQTPSS